MPHPRPLIRTITRALALAAACLSATTVVAEPATLRGGGDRDVLRGTPGGDRLLGRGGHDRLFGGRGDDRLSGGPGRDRLSGGPGHDILLGFTGRDVLIGGRGRDVARGGRGNDLIRLVDGTRDNVSCGRGIDVAVLDRKDRVIDRSCERVKRPATGSAPQATAYLAAAGDVADCGPGAQITARLLDGLPGTVAVLGDAAYDDGTPDEFASCYAPTWGRHKARTRPAVGNHEYGTAGAAGYFDYFGAAAGVRGKGWYSYDVGAWHAIALNSNCAEVGGCQAGSEQERWLREDLAADDARCTLAYMHHPRFSSGNVHGGSPAVESLWRALEDNGAELVLAGHDHDYERFAPQTTAGALDLARGVRQFVVGTGGRPLRSFGPPKPHSEVRDNSAWGVLHLALRDGHYDWRFAAEPGKSFADSGTAACH